VAGRRSRLALLLAEAVWQLDDVWPGQGDLADVHPRTGTAPIEVALAGAGGRQAEQAQGNDGIADAFGETSRIPWMPASGQPWNTARFSSRAAAWAARSRSVSSRSGAPRSASSTSRRSTVNGTRTSTRGSTRR
jgi:hypothetical protein